MKLRRNKQSSIAHSMVNSFNQAFNQDTHDDEDEGYLFKSVQLMHTQRKSYLPKNFHEEIHALKYLSKFLTNAIIRIERKRTFYIDRLLENMLQDIFKDNPEVNQDHTLQIRNAMFSTPDDVAHLLKASNVCIQADMNLLVETVQGCEVTDIGAKYDNNWICMMTRTKLVKSAKVAISRTMNELNFGNTANAVRFVIFIMVPESSSELHSHLEIARTFGTLFKNKKFLEKLEAVETEDNFLKLFQQEINMRMNFDRHNKSIGGVSTMLAALAKPSQNHAGDEYGDFSGPARKFPLYYFGYGIFIDYKRRLPHYLSDLVDAFYLKRTRIRKKDHLSDYLHMLWRMLRGSIFVAINVVLPVMAFGSTNEFNTRHADCENTLEVRCPSYITMESTLIGQVIAGVIFALFSTQPLGLVMTTPPITLLMTLLLKIAKAYGVHFLQFYGMTGIFIGSWLILFSLCNASRFLKWVTPSIEEVFAIFTAWAFLNEAIENTNEVFDIWWKNAEVSPNPRNFSVIELPAYAQAQNYTADAALAISYRDRALAWVFLEIATAVIGLALFIPLRTTPFLHQTVRNLFSDYALLFAVLICSILRRFLLSDINFEPYTVHYSAPKIDAWTYYNPEIYKPESYNLDTQTTFVALGVSLSLAVLFYLDQGFCSIVVNGHKNKLSKPGGFHADLFLVGVINIILSIFGMPWLHLALPHSDWHVLSVSAHKFDNIDGTLVATVKKGSVLEQRVTALLGHGLIAILLIPQAFDAILQHVPVPVLDGVFLYFAIASLLGNQVVTRWLLAFTESSAYSATSYLKKVPLKKIHLFSLVCLIETVLLIVVGFYVNKYAKLGFPFLVILMIPIRHILCPQIINIKSQRAADKIDDVRWKSYMDILDGHH